MLQYMYLAMTVGITFLCIIYVITGIMRNKVDNWKRKVTIIHFRTKLTRICVICCILHLLLGIFYAETLSGRLIGIFGIWFFYPDLQKRKIEQAVVDAFEK